MGLPSFDKVSPFLEALGMRLEVMEPTRVVGSMDLGPDDPPGGNPAALAGHHQPV